MINSIYCAFILMIGITRDAAPRAAIRDRAVHIALYRCEAPTGDQKASVD